MSESNLDGIAIVGMHGRFPGASSVEAFWENLVAGRETITFFSDEELAAAGLDPNALRQQGDYVPARGVLENAECFDASFFGIHPKEAEVMDPQQRVFLEACTEALERAGYDPARIEGSIGVYAGATFNTYYLSTLHPRPELRELVGSEQVMLGNEKDYLATRVAYKLNLRGPAISVNTACSSSLVAVCQACQSLLTYQCDMALAGGVSVRSPQQQGYFYQEGNIASPDGHTRTFDEKAQGTVFSNGVTVVVLKRLEEAIADGDQIYAVVKGSALNNDGAQRVSFGAPGVEGQAEVVSLAQAIADVEPDTVTYVEAHGTATPLGDPIEVAALTKAFRQGTERKQFCALGAVKSNVGHLDAAAGTAGLIKTALSLTHKTLVPTLHFKCPNPKMDLENTPFFVNDQLRDWETATGTPRRAGVSSFGTGGTNAHVVLEEAPQLEASSSSRLYQILTLSAKTQEALEQASLNLASHLKDFPDLSLADVAHTLQVGRSEFSERKIAVCESVSEAAELLEKPDAKKVFTLQQTVKNPPVVFMFPGQGSQYAGMAVDLYKHEAVFREFIDRCADILLPVLGMDLRTILFPPSGEEKAAEESLRQTRFTQPALFCIEYAMAQLWMSWGVVPAAMIGHSVGEYVAGCLSGVFSLEDGLVLVARRAELVQAQLPGCMLAIRMPEKDVAPLLNENLSVAAINAPKSCVVSGPEDAINDFRELLTSKKIDSLLLPTSHAFHSAMMDPVIEPFKALLKKTKLSPPKIPYISNVSAKWITPEEATSPDYWAGHVRDTVRFADGMGELLEDPQRILLEVGPGRSLGQLTRQHPDRDKKTQVISSLGAPREAEYRDLQVSLGRLWLAGVSVDWTSYREGERRHRVVLPTYPFARIRYLPTTPVAGETESAPAPQPVEFALPASAGATESGIQEREADAVLPVENRRDRLVKEIRQLVEELSGTCLDGVDEGIDFIELGLDSLLLTQAATLFQRKFGVSVSFRQLMETLGSAGLLADYLDEELEPGAFAPEPAAPAHLANSSGTASSIPIDLTASLGENAGLAQLLQQQIQTSQKILDAMHARTGIAPAIPVKEQSTSTPAAAAKSESKGHGPFRPIDRGKKGELNKEQQEWLDAFMGRYLKRTSGSKRLTEKNRPGLADPRSTAGFKQALKEIVYPIYVSRSDSSRVWDVDGNEYIDFVMGFGASLFGHRPPFVIEAVKKQLELGFEIGPIQPIVGETAALFRELTQTERVGFCNTGSEAVLAAMRVARTVSGRDKIATFSGDYHGIFDEVLYRPINVSGKPGAAPIAPGIPRSATSQLVVLEYGSPEALQWLKENSHDLAAVMVEPVQSRRLDLQPKEFLQEVRRITEKTETALIFDEVVTGFRVQMGGAQAYFGVKADIATYGKVVGGGLPIGVVAGTARYLDALDGGQWRYGDDSFPEVGVTFFAGTFVRHPIIIATAKAVLEQLKEEGPALQERVAKRAQRAAEEIGELLVKYKAPYNLTQFSSLMHLSVMPESPYGGLIFPSLRERGIHTFENRLFVFTTAHTDSDVDHLVNAMEQSLAELANAGIFEESIPSVTTTDVSTAETPSMTVSRSVDGKLQVPATDGQVEIWLAIQWAPEITCAYNQIVEIAFSGELDIEAMRSAIGEVANRHQSLRTTFSSDGLWQEIAESIELDIPLHDFSSLSREESEKKLNELREKESRMAFDLLSGPLFKAFIVKRDSESFHLLLSAHHIVCDGWSYDVLLRDLAGLYNNRTIGTPLSDENPMQMVEYVDWLGESTQIESNANARKYWLEQYSDPPLAIELPSDYPRNSKRSFEGAHLSRDINPDLYAAIKKFAAQNKCTVFTVLVGAYIALIHRLSSQSDIAVGFPVAGQMLAGNRALVGHCVNLIPLRCYVESTDPISNFLSQVRKQVLDAFEHSSFTYGELVKELALPRDSSRSTLVSAIFNVDRVSHGELSFQGTTARVSTVPKSKVNFDVFINILQGENDLKIECEYSADLFNSDTINRWLGCMEALLSSLVVQTDATVGTLNMLTDDQRQLSVFGWNQTSKNYPTGKTIHSLFEARANEQPEATAIIHGDRRLTYSQLNDRANVVARQLRSFDLSPDSVVGICTERGINLVASILGILKAGCAYLPLDPNYPSDRISFCIEDAAVPVLLTQQSLLKTLPKGCYKTVLLDTLDYDELVSNPVTSVQDSNLAYVIYTSGSTGQPKGVSIEHLSAVSLIHWAEDVFEPKEIQGVLFSTSVCFDLSIFEIFVPLSLGGTVIVSDNVLELPTLSARDDVTLINTVPSAISELASIKAIPASVQVVNLAGEPLATSLVNQIYDVPTVKKVYDLYGPTEDTTYSTWTLRLRDERATIGRPITNTQAYIVDSKLQAVPIGVAGELLLGGQGLARGYLNRADLTQERFISNPFDVAGRSRVYRTGDLCRYRSDGRIEYLGRMDHQVKIRGFRIELGEIEAVILDHPDVRECVVVTHDFSKGQPSLVAYFASDRVDLEEELKERIRAKLPDYMVPALFELLEALPKTPNGKIDRKALPEPAFSKSERMVTGEPPRGELEIQLSKIWQNVLNLQSIGREESFFKIGGHSLLAIRLVDQINKRFGVKFLLPDLIQVDTIAAIAERLETLIDVPKNRSCIVEVQKGGKLPPFYCIHGGGGTVLFGKQLSHYMGDDIPFYGINAYATLHPGQLDLSVEDMGARYLDDLRQLQPKGPYFIGGYCMGGLIAYEMAQRLIADGDEVGQVVLINTFNPIEGAKRTKNITFGEIWKAKLIDQIRNLRQLPYRERLSYLNQRLIKAIPIRALFVWKRLIHGITWQKPTPLEISSHPLLMESFYDQVGSKYRPKPLNTKVVVLRPQESIEELNDPHMGWNDIVIGQLEVIDLPINPVGMFSEPFVSLLGRELGNKHRSASNIEKFATPANTA